MHTIRAETYYGGQSASKGKISRDGFKLNLNANLTEDQLVVQASRGLKGLNYTCASACNKALGKKNNAEVEFSDKAARTVEKTIAEEVFKKFGFVINVTATRHEHGAGGGEDFIGAAKAKLAQKESAENENALAEYLTLCGYDGPTHTEDGNDFHPEAVAASAKRIKGRKDAAIAEARAKADAENAAD